MLTTAIAIIILCISITQFLYIDLQALAEGYRPHFLQGRPEGGRD